MTARPTIKTICAQTGLSTATVSKALRNSETVRKETRDLVQKVARDLGYATNMHGVSLVTGRTYQVAVIMTAPDADADEWEGVEYAQLLSGISHALESSLYRVALYAVHDFAEAVETIRRIVVNRQADGVILSGTRPDDGRVKILMDADFPFVSYGTTTAHGAHAFVDADNAGIIAASLARLAERGHRRIALLNPPRRALPPMASGSIRRWWPKGS
jgi:LacI family transcriptional regulator